MPDNLSNLLSTFAGDKTSGSAELAESVIKIAELACEMYSAEELTLRFPRIAVSLVDAQPSMAAIINMVDELCIGLENGRFKETASNISEDFKSTVEKTVGAASHALSKYKIISTYSRSSLVERALMGLQDKKRTAVYLSESRPACEGLKLTNKLLEAGIEVTLTADIILPELIKKSEVFVIGADAVAADRFYNKTGTGIMCKAAREAGIPVIIIANSYKFLPANLCRLYSIPDTSYEDSLVVKLPKVGYFGSLFEACPLEYVSDIIFEGGKITMEEVNSLIVKTQISQILKSHIENKF